MNTIFDNMNAVGSLPEHDYVDLGLPSGTLWATENIKDAEGNDLYFAWGETCGYAYKQIGDEEGKRAFAWEDYKFGPANALKKYNGTDGLVVLEPEDDAAMVNWGKEWRMPTNEQFKELKANTISKWTEIGGVMGAKFTSIVEGHEDNFVFFPVVGYASFGEVRIEGCSIYWSASLDETDISRAGELFIYNGAFGVRAGNRYRGCYVRPVHVQNIPVKPVIFMQ